MTPATAPPLGADGVAANGTAEADVEAFRARVRACIATEVTPRVARAEADRRFPREALHAVGAAGILRERWEGGLHGDLLKSVALSEEMGRAACGGVGVGISLHLEAVTSILRRYASTPLLDEHRDAALDGTLVGCLATTELVSGSNLNGIQVTAERCAAGWHVHGRKAFVSPGAAADFALVLCREAGAAQGSVAAPLMLVLVPREGLRAERTLETVGMRGLGTARMAIDAVVPEDAVVGRAGTGLVVVSWGLVHERLALSAALVGVASLALTLAVTRARRREQFGRPLFDHQALRLRLAELWTEVEVLRRAVASTAAGLGTGLEAVRDTAACKVRAARMAEHVVTESMHVFGGAGYLEDETPLGRIYRDVKIGRLGAGSDEMMLELVASALPEGDAEYDALVGGLA